MLAVLRRGGPRHLSGLGQASQWWGGGGTGSRVVTGPLPQPFPQRHPERSASRHANADHGTITRQNRSTGVGGYLRINDGTAAQSETSSQSDTATCTGGRKVVSGGFIITAAAGNVAEITVSQNQATSDTVWTVAAAEDNDGDVGNWNIEAFAVCVTASA